MVVDVPYQDLKHTLQCLKLQVIDSREFVFTKVPDGVHSPQELFYWLKPQLKYKRDPRGVELLQTVQTLMDNNGRGDCDCFTIAALAFCSALGFGPLHVVLVGNSVFAPSHIYIDVFDQKRGQTCVFDLTNPIYNMERKYRYKQRLKFRI